MTNRPPDVGDEPLPPAPTAPGDTFDAAASNPAPDPPADDDTPEA